MPGSTQYNIGQLYRAAKRELAALSDVPQNEALLLCGHFLGAGDRTAVLLRSEEPVPQEKAEAMLEALAQRARRPLQYILGRWPFDGMELEVGEGVLVPREDTLALVELACERLESMDAPGGLRILDLCAGTGAVGLAAAGRLPGSQVTCVELSGDALPYLQRNVERYGGGRVSIFRADVLAGPQAAALAPGSFDAILSNPPYIPTAHIAGLAREVRQEPAMALDGGSDGMTFYTAIAALWTPVVRPGGVLCMELGQGQLEDVKKIMIHRGWEHIGSRRDFSGIERAIIGTRVK